MRKLATIGATSDPAQAIADKRPGDASRKKKSEDKLKKRDVTHITPEPTITPFQRATTDFEALEDKTALNLLQVS